MRAREKNTVSHRGEHQRKGLPSVARAAYCSAETSLTRKQSGTGFLPSQKDAAELDRVGVALGVDHEDLRLVVELERVGQLGIDLVGAQGEQRAEGTAPLSPLMTIGSPWSGTPRMRYRAPRRYPGPG